MKRPSKLSFSQTKNSSQSLFFEKSVKLNKRSLDIAEIQELLLFQRKSHIEHFDDMSIEDEENLDVHRRCSDPKDIEKMKRFVNLRHLLAQLEQLEGKPSLI